MRRELRSTVGRSNVIERTTTLADSPGGFAFKRSQIASDRGVQQVRLCPDRNVISMSPDRDATPPLRESAWPALLSQELVRRESIVEKVAPDTRRTTVPLNQCESIGCQLSVHTLQPTPVPRVLILNRDVPGGPGSHGRPGSARWFNATVVALGLSASSLIAVFIAWAPWPVGFALAIACATALCIWLQRHPD